MTPYLTFGEALEALKEGKRVAREGWNGANMWVALMQCLYLEADKVNERTKYFIGDNTPLDCQAYLVIWTVQGKWQPGWLPSQADLLSDDWFVVG